MTKEASLWAMSRQDPQHECSLQTLQQRQAARKAARLGAVSSRTVQQDQKPLQACVSGLGKSPDSIISPHLSSAVAGGFTSLQVNKDVQILSSTTSCLAGDCAVQASGAGSAGVGAGQTEKAALHRQTGSVRNKASSKSALRVQSLRQELAAAEAVVAELKSWLADAEAELEEERVD